MSNCGDQPRLPYLILAIDDVIDNLQIISHMLEPENYRTTFAQSGREGIKRALNVQPDLILLDLMMPELDGLQVCEILKKNPKTRDIPIIFITANHDRKNLIAAFEKGAIDYITKPFNRDELLARVHNHLELKNRREQLRQAKIQAEQLAQEKIDFFNRVSHEIRTPMNAILSISELLFQQEYNNDKRELMKTIHINCDALLSLVDNLLDVAKLEANKVVLEEQVFDLRELLDNLYRLFSVVAQHKNLRFVVELDPQLPTILRGDAARLQQILQNLVSNAIKFTAQGEVVVRVTTDGAAIAPDQQVSLVFSVSDTGIGMTEPEQGQLFQAFTQSNVQISRQYGGTGLGLNICRQLLTLMGGEIGVVSQLNQGTTFSVRLALPLGGNHREVTSDRQLLTRGEVTFNRQLTYHVLLVEDVLVNQEVITSQLQSLGIAPAIAPNGKIAVERCQSEQFHVVFMDCQMPILNGYEATRCIRHQEQGHKHQIIVGLTAFNTPQDRQKCLDAGMDDYLSKPVFINQLIAILNKWLAVSAAPLRGDGPSETDTKMALDQHQVNEIADINLNQINPKFVDLERFRVATNNNPSFAQRILKLFFRDAQGFVDRSREAYHQGDRQEIMVQQHKLKGIASSLGIFYLEDLAKFIENQVQGPDLTPVERALQRQGRALKQLILKGDRPSQNPITGVLPHPPEELPPPP